MNGSIAKLGGQVALPGFERNDFSVVLASNGQEAQLVVGAVGSPVIVINTGVFDSEGRNIETDEEGYAPDFAHAIGVTNYRNGWQPWDDKSALYGRVLAAVKGYAKKDLGEEMGKEMLFFKD